MRNTQNDIKLLGLKLRTLREERDLTQAQVAKALGVSRPLVAAYEAGVQAPRYCDLVKLHKILGVPRGSLLAA